MRLAAARHVGRHPGSRLVAARPVRGVASVASSCYTSGMVRPIKLRQVGGSVGATLPKDMADRLHLAVGDSVLAVETENGILLTPYDPTVEAGLALAARVAKRYRHALRELAK